jgi:hypothetical protein
MSFAWNDRDVLLCAPGSGVEPGTGHHVRQGTHCPLALQVSVGLLLQYPNVLSWALYTEVETLTWHQVRQWTHCPPALPESVGLFLALPRKCYHVLSEPEQTLVLGISFASEHTVHMPYQEAKGC